MNLSNRINAWQVSKEGDDDPLSALTAATGDEAAAGSSQGGGRRRSRGHSHAGSGGGGGSHGGTGGAWRRYYEGLELIEEIKRDLTRLYPRCVVGPVIDLTPQHIVIRHAIDRC